MKLYRKKTNKSDWKSNAEKVVITIYQLKEANGHIFSMEIDGVLTKQSRENIIEKMIGQDSIRPNIEII